MAFKRQLRSCRQDLDWALWRFLHNEPQPADVADTLRFALDSMAKFNVPTHHEAKRLRDLHDVKVTFSYVKAVINLIDWTLQPAT
jgi:hypothetical protein